MNEVQKILTAFIAGGLIGTIFFGGLWWTVRKGMTSRHAAIWFTGSLIVRVTLALAGFYFVGRDDWQRLLGCLFGFIIARLAVMQIIGSRGQKPPTSSAEAHHAS